MFPTRLPYPWPLKCRPKLNGFYFGLHPGLLGVAFETGSASEPPCVILDHLIGDVIEVGRVVEGGARPRRHQS
jgi:hypothetical protein